jgi:hypothetical protein
VNDYYLVHINFFIIIFLVLDNILHVNINFTKVLDGTNLQIYIGISYYVVLV